MSEPAGMVAATITKPTDIVDLHHHRYRIKNDFGGGQLRRPNGKCKLTTTVRKLGAVGTETTTPPNGKKTTPPNGGIKLTPLNGKTSTLPNGRIMTPPNGKITTPPTGKMMTPPFPVLLSASVFPGHFKSPFQTSRTSNRYGVKFETCESVEWKAMSKQFAR